MVNVSSLITSSSWTKMMESKLFEVTGSSLSPSPLASLPWTEVNEDWQCHAYDKKKFTGFLKDIPEELDPLKTCYEAPLTFASNEQEFRKVPDECEWDWERMKGTWFVGAPNCRPVLKNIIDYGCMENEPGFKRIEGEVVDIGKHEDWYRMCTTVPYHTSGKTYLPVQCESRTSWFKTRRYALYNIPAWNC
ncbi:hypothetical protein K435DRAFT_467254 [Dendrothele bispora CBS 962.96]|uniref:Uncharacterized protein n=1 Tax=Dendrothele bispora (strain CBS 962.96) TaxID=1314807 RepID=A0A4S8L0F6_DENBC|nr:hypothetical protein K435DRAFT_467254 [Dendrothele bispora CBS 962.96]